TTWLITLRKGVDFTNGMPVTAEDVVFSYNYTKYVDTHIGYIWYASYIIYVKQIQAINNYTVLLTLNRSIPADLVEKNLFASIFIVPESIWKNVTDPTHFTSPQAFIGSGPFELESYQPGVGYTFVANPNYFMGKPVVNTLKILVVSSSQLPNMLLKGEVDAGSFDNYFDIIPFLNNSQFGIVAYSPGLEYTLEFNLLRYPFNITEFRQALVYAINLTAIYDALGGEKAGYMGGPFVVAPNTPYFNPNLYHYYNYSPQKALEILQDLGFKYVNGQLLSPQGQPVSFTLIIPSDDTIAQTIASYIKNFMSNIGISITIKSVPSNLRTQYMASGDFDMMINIFGGALVPYALAYFVKGSVQYIPGFNNATIKQILNQAQFVNLSERIVLMNLINILHN
ncbi:ABC transporter substrate-binding protein, partial [Sulfolobus sp. E3]